MPNIFINLLTIFGSKLEIAKVLLLLKNDEEWDLYPEFSIDLEKVEPLPPSIFIEDLMSCTNDRCFHESEITSWKLENWGTTRNTLQGKWIQKNTLSFLTADGIALPIVHKLSLIFRQVEFQFSWCGVINEKTMQGVLRYKNGQIRCQYAPFQENEESKMLYELIKKQQVNQLNKLTKGIMKYGKKPKWTTT